MEQTKSNSSRTILIIFAGCGILFLCTLVLCVIMYALGIFGFNEFFSNIEKYSDEFDETEFANPSPAGSSVTVEGLTFTVIEAKDMGSSLKSSYELPDYLIGADPSEIDELYQDCTTSAKFIVVTYSVKNNSAKSVSTAGLHLYDADGTKYSAATNIYKCKEDSTVYQTINPGIQATFTEVYEIPKDVSDLRLEVTDFEFILPARKYLLLEITK
jgi:hypothetical protein